MNKNINVDLFRRFSASNKVEMVNALTKDELLSVFLQRGDFNTKAYFTNRYGDDIPTYVTYTPDDKAKVIKSILLHYLYTKYADKLKADK